MKIAVVLSISATTLVGCTTIPSMPDEQAADMNALADKIQCEISKSFQDTSVTSGYNYSGWGATYSITRNTTQSAGASLNPLKWISPAGVDKLVYNANGGADREFYRNAKVDYSVNVLKKNDSCQKAKAYKSFSVSPADFGLREWVSKISHTNGKQLSSFSYSVRVTLTINGGIGGEFANGKWSADTGLSGKRTTLQTVDFTFSPAPPTSGPLSVKIVNWPKSGGAEGLHDRDIPRRGQLGQRPTNTAPSGDQGPVPNSVIQQNRSLQQLQMLDRVSPEFLQQ